MTDNHLLGLEALGQDLWLDFVSRAIIRNGDLARMIEQDGLSGVTSNPTIFEKVIDHTSDYDDEIRSLAIHGQSTPEIAREIMVDDIRAAADQFRTLYERSNKRQGYVSIEVSPLLANDTSGTIRQARELWNAVSRPNIFVKVPATREGLTAIRDLTAEGINVNVTLLFGLPRYREVAQAYIDGIRSRMIRNEPVEGIASVASFFLSRIDVLIDPMLDRRSGEAGETAQAAAALKGKTGIASAVMAYAMYKEMFGGPAFSEASAKGARPQRVLWASTGTKNPAYSDVMYVDPLIAPDTISTQPQETMKAYREHGNPALRLEQGYDAAQRDLYALSQVGINIDEVTYQLEREGIEKFSESFEKLMEAIERKRIDIVTQEAIESEQIGIA